MVADTVSYPSSKFSLVFSVLGSLTMNHRKPMIVSAIWDRDIWGQGQTAQIVIFPGFPDRNIRQWFGYSYRLVLTIYKNSEPSRYPQKVFNPSSKECSHQKLLSIYFYKKYINFFFQPSCFWSFLEERRLTQPSMLAGKLTWVKKPWKFKIKLICQS